MTKPSARLQFLFPGALLILLLSSCHYHPTRRQELNQLKQDLFAKTNDFSELPVYADPPTGDYENFPDNQFTFWIDSNEVEQIWKYRKELEPGILQRLDSGFSWVYLAAYLRYESAVPLIRDTLLKCDQFYGWEGGDYSTLERYLEDGQYCYQMAYIAAIEHITGKPLSGVVTLTGSEYASLRSRADKCIEGQKDSLENFCSARWLLDKLKQ